MDRILAAAALLAALPIAAEPTSEQGQVSVRVLDYADRQPGADRVSVRAPSFQLTTPIGGRWSLGASFIHDAISGASPQFHTRALTPLRDTRRAGDLSLSHAFENAALTLTGAASHEADYRSQGLSLSGTWSTEDRNRSLAWGIGRSWDDIQPAVVGLAGGKKQMIDLHLGITQVLTPRSLVQLSVGHNRAEGFLSDPYKLFDVRPEQRRATRVLVRRNDHLPDWESTSRLAYRFYRDSFGIQAHTLSWELEKSLGGGWSLTPALRLYSQTAARFYVEVDPAAAPFATQPPEDWRFSSLDQRLSAFGAVTAGLKVGWQINPDWGTDLKFEHYEQRGAWHVGGPGSLHLAPLTARSWQWGLTRTF
ncbi:DUF3570 domain-containing protein [Inhella gelatinilytica]|uniref:DUF3570 domain-containing protein n=1 Tax=Inhella gelatinilytica TaxID=2795030 RepID=A0A931IX89_9BURK|nr:DUF3570 domain-containing protein [Inhella gelatinilytica]MBH9552690.1 DUF3570 domain-containing protein [Inhella gelatinilytica]